MPRVVKFRNSQKNKIRENFCSNQPNCQHQKKKDKAKTKTKNKL